MKTPFDPIRLLHLARNLANGQTDEAILRTAVGQAYYAVFLIARDEARIDKRDRWGQHDRTHDAIRRKSLRAGADYASLKDLRVQADYYLLAEDPFYEDWAVNWRDADSYAEALIKFVADQKW
jgi:hypothetical protein